METHNRFMQRCLDLAANGLGATYPNPLVGAVIVCNGKIIGEGWHRKAGGPHAEIEALSRINNTGDLANATLYVNLEPCNHFGKTPPCTIAIIKSGIKTVVIGTLDSHSLVAGTGVAALRNAGIHVQVGVLELACRQLNKRFFTFHEKSRPYIILKWAESADSFLAPAAQIAGKPFFISNKLSRQLAHKWRTEEASILIGTRTALLDNPILTARMWVGNQPIRLVIDQQQKISLTSPLFNDHAPTLVFTKKAHRVQEVEVPFSNLPDEIISQLHARNIQSVLIEGGRATLQAFIDLDLWDEARIFTSGTVLKRGIPAPAIERKTSHISQVYSDQLTVIQK